MNERKVSCMNERKVTAFVNGKKGMGRLYLGWPIVGHASALAEEDDVIDAQEDFDARLVDHRTHLHIHNIIA